MNNLQSVFQTYGPQYLRAFGSSMPSHHRKALEAILQCRTAQAGMTRYHCDGCTSSHEIMRSCGNRHCPLCQYGKTQVWLNKQLDRQLPTHHFMISFTAPAEIRPFMRQHQKACYAALFQASSHTLKDFMADPKYVGGEVPGFFGVLHTWGSQLHFHPHVHYVVPGGALTKDKTRWILSSPDYFAHYENLSKVFRGHYYACMEKAGLLDEIPSSVWRKGWNVNVQAVGSAENTLRYLAGYVFRVAISNHRITKVEDGRVYFTYKQSKTRERKVMSLKGMEFIRRFLQHVLPTGFMKVRYYGFYSGAAKIDWERLRGLIDIAHAFENEQVSAKPKESPQSPTCPHCGTLLTYVDTLVPWNGKLISVKRRRRERTSVGT